MALAIDGRCSGDSGLVLVYAARRAWFAMSSVRTPRTRGENSGETFSRQAALMFTCFADPAFAIAAVTCSMPFLYSAFALSGSIRSGK